MQTFLPYPNFSDSARTLDNKRLGKQRVETLQIMSSLMTGTGWVHHPATMMWQGYEYALFVYQEAICFEWVRRGFFDTCYRKTADLLFDYIPRPHHDEPPWLGDNRVHLSHQSNLARKLPKHYGPLFPWVRDDFEYFWPYGKEPCSDIWHTRVRSSRPCNSPRRITRSSPTSRTA